MTQQKKVQVPNCILLLVVSICEDTHDMGLSKQEKKRKKLHASLNQPQSIGIIQTCHRDHGISQLHPSKMPQGCI